MGRCVQWEWKLSKMDDAGDIAENYFADRLDELEPGTLSAAISGGKCADGDTWELVLTRWTSTPCGHDVDHTTAYVTDGVLDTTTDAGYRVPKKVSAEFNNAKEN